MPLQLLIGFVHNYRSLQNLKNFCTKYCIKIYVTRPFFHKASCGRKAGKYYFLRGLV